ncbi:MAG: undecaprenyl-diphosphate phosphatase [Ruminococcus sp.]|nr:undecaprenyl-diphosphate phosphatase [Ruminococcus sp.]
MTVIDAIIQGIVQGLTEFLPVSSSGHLNITQHILGVTEDNLFFSVMLHIGTLVAVCAFYYKLIWRLIKAFGLLVADIFRGRFKWKEMDEDRRMLIMLVIGLIPLFLLFLPIPGTEWKIKDLADIFSGAKYFIIVGISLLLTSLLLLIGDMFSRGYLAEKRHRKTPDGRKSMTVVDAVVVGLVQCCAAVFPGLSRSGSTLAAGQMRGVNKQKALDYTFILAIPSIIAAALLELKDVLDAPEGMQIDILPIIVGMAVAAFVGYFSIVLFKWLLKTDKMIVFILYTAIVGAAVIVISIMEMNSGVNLFTGAAIV